MLRRRCDSVPPESFLGVVISGTRPVTLWTGHIGTGHRPGGFDAAPRREAYNVEGSILGEQGLVQGRGKADEPPVLDGWGCDAGRLTVGNRTWSFGALAVEGMGSR